MFLEQAGFNFQFRCVIKQSSRVPKSVKRAYFAKKLREYVLHFSCGMLSLGDLSFKGPWSGSNYLF